MALDGFAVVLFAVLPPALKVFAEIKATIVTMRFVFLLSD